MVFAYIVRCNFTDPAREQAWNDWYSGPKIAQMLAKPHFRSCQRFRLASGHGRNYLALWTLQSPEAFNTAEYRSDWGFFDWERYIADWSRDLFDGGERPESTFAVPSGGGLQVVAFDRLTAEQADATRAAIAPALSSMMWLPVIGLDRHTPLIGLDPLPRLVSFPPPPGETTAGMQGAIYRPISDFHRSG
jgi:hypothetical protein